MKKLLIPTLSILMIACNSINPKGVSNDTYGCNSAAGQTWSQLNKNCIQVFNVGTRLNPTEKSDGAIISAFAIVNKENTKSEIFLPHSTSSIILNKTQSGVYSDGIYRYDSNNFSLSKNNVLIYKGE